MKIGFVGFGLIGGSIAKAIKSAHPDCYIIVTSRTLSSIEPARQDGIADETLLLQIHILKIVTTYSYVHR